MLAKQSILKRWHGRKREGKSDTETWELIKGPACTVSSTIQLQLHNQSPNHQRLLSGRGKSAWVAMTSPDRWQEQSRLHTGDRTFARHMAGRKRSQRLLACACCKLAAL